MLKKLQKPTLYQISQAGQANGEIKSRGGGNKGLTQAYEFRELAHREAMALGECECKSLDDRVTRARAIKDLNSVWYAASERIRIIKGKPMPGSLRPVAKPKKVRTVSTKPLETLPQSDVTGPSSTVQSSIDTALDKSMLKESLSTELPLPPSAGVEPV